MRKFEFQTGEYYHIYNRGIDKRNIFMNVKDYVRFIRSMREFNNNSTYAQRLYIKNRKLESNSKALELDSLLLSLPALVNILCYCLLPNHFHLLLMPKVNNGIELFMHKLNTGYTNYFNFKYERTGSLFGNKYRAIHVKKYSHFLKLAVYINCNSEVHGINKAENWVWSSYLDYINKRNGSLCNKDIILNEFRNINEFQDFCNQVLPDIIKIPELIKFLLE